MHIILATEIWGRTPHVNLMVDAFKSVACDVTVVDPYAGADPGVASEEEAYTRYLGECGHSEYASRVSRAVSQVMEPVCLVGFSAGAGAVWTAAQRGVW